MTKDYADKSYESIKPNTYWDWFITWIAIGVCVHMFLSQI